MEAKNYVSKSGKEAFLYSVKTFLEEKAEGLNTFEIVMLSLYSLMTVSFLVLAVLFVLLMGFKL